MLIAKYNHQLLLIVKIAWPLAPGDVLKKPMPRILLTRDAGRKSIDKIWMTRSARLSWWEARAICVDSVAILRFTLKRVSAKHYCQARSQARTVLTNLCVSLVYHREAFTNTDLGPLVVEVAVGADKLCFSQEGIEFFEELCTQLRFILQRGAYLYFWDGCRTPDFLKPLVLSTQMLECSIKNIIVGGDLLNLSRKC